MESLLTGEQRLFLIAIIMKKQILMLCTLCKTLYNVLIHSHVIILGLTFWRKVQKIEYPDFRSPEVSIPVNVGFLEWTILFQQTNLPKKAF